MKTLLSCEFNMDTGCVELRYSDDSMISINCTAVEDEVANSRFQRSELDRTKSDRRNDHGQNHIKGCDQRTLGNKASS